MKPSTARHSFYPITIAIAVGAVLALSCGTLFNVKMASPPVSLEGKDYTVQFSMANAEKAQKVTLYYRVNGGPYRSVEPRLNGSLREYVIPSAELAAGRLEYYVIVLDADGKEHKEGETAVSVLSQAQGLAQAQINLARRVQVAAPAEIGVNAGLDIALSVLQPLASTQATIFVLDPGSTTYRSVALTASGGVFHFLVPAADMHPGSLAYYFKISEQEPDVGLVEATYPAGAASQPGLVRVLGLDELAARMAAELVQSVTHQAPGEAIATADLPVSLTLSLPPQGTLAPLLLAPPTVLLHYGTSDNSLAFQSVPMTPDGNGNYAAVITRDLLASGVNSYFFTISAQARDVGAVDALYPANGDHNPIVYRIVSLEELKGRRLQEYASKLSHLQPQGATAIEPLALSVTADNAPAVRSVVLHYKRNPRDQYRDLTLQTADGGFAAAVSPEELPEGVLYYYFTVNLSFPDIGRVKLTLPQRGANAPYTLNVESKSAARDRLQADLTGRVHHSRLLEAAADADTEVSVTIDSLKPGTQAQLFLKRPGDKSALSKKMTINGNTLTAVIGRVDLAQGFNQYYIEISEPNAALRGITLSLPENGSVKPWTFNVKKTSATSPAPSMQPAPSPQPSPKPSPQPSPKPSPAPSPQPSPKPSPAPSPQSSPKASPQPSPQPSASPKPSPANQAPLTAKDIIFTPVKEAPAGQSLKIQLQIKQPAAGLVVTFAWRPQAGKGDFKPVKTTRSGNNFIAALDASALTAGAVIEYYFTIQPKGGSELRYPAADQAPFSLTVSDKGKVDQGNGDKNN